MKKMVCTVIAVVMFAAILGSLAISAGDMLFTDNFDSGVFNELDWRVEGSLFAIQQGGPTKSPHLEGWAEAVVQQTSYGEDAPAPRVYGANFAYKVDTWFFDDGGNGADEHWVALWWADHFEDQIGNDRIVYTVRATYETRTIAIIVHGEGVGMDYFPEEVSLAEWKIPDSVEFEMDTGSPTVFNLGMRINGTQIDGFFNGQKVVSATAPIIHQYKCPLIFWNGQCWTGFDNVCVSTADYDLFNEGSSASPAPAAQSPAATEKVIETKKVVVGTDEDGNDITEIVTEEVVRPAAQTSNGTTGGTSSATGDMAIAVAAVMVVALGSAIAVRKITLGKNRE
jgi:hypothetical protein